MELHKDGIERIYYGITYNNELTECVLSISIVDDLGGHGIGFPLPMDHTREDIAHALRYKANTVRKIKAAALLETDA